MSSENSSIPALFWYVSSFCMLLATIVLVVIAWRSNSISIEVASAKISLSSALTSIKDTKDTLQKENDRLKMEKENFERKYSEAIDELVKIQTGGEQSKSSDEPLSTPLKPRTKQLNPEEIKKILDKYRAAINDKGTIYESITQSLHEMNSKIAQTEDYIQSIK